MEAISTEVRRICECLSPSVLENVGLTAALEWALVEALRQLPAGQSCQDRFVCADDVEERLGSTPRRASRSIGSFRRPLANAVRHAVPRELLLGVELAEDGCLAVRVEDDGVASTPDRADWAAALPTSARGPA